APTDLRFLQFAAEIFGVQVVEKLCQVEMPALRSRVARANTTKTHAVHAVAGAAGTRVFEIRLDERSGRFLSIHAGEQQSGRSFEYGKGSAAQEVGEAHENSFFPAANRERQTGIRIELDAEARRAALATQAREHALKKGGAARGKTRPAGQSDKPNMAEPSTRLELADERPTGSSVFAPNRGRRYFLVCLFSVMHRVLCAYYGIVQIVPLELQPGAIRSVF